MMTKVSHTGYYVMQCHAVSRFVMLSCAGEPGGGHGLRVKLLQTGVQQQETDSLHLHDPHQETLSRTEMIGECISDI